MASSRFQVLMIVGAAVGVLGGATIAFVMSGDRKPATAAPAASVPPPTAPVAPVAPGASNGVTAVAPPAPNPPIAAPSVSPDVPTPEHAGAKTLVAAKPEAKQPPRRQSAPAKSTTPPPDGEQTAKAEILNQEGKTAMFGSRWGEAETRFQQALLLDPTSAKYRYNLAMVLFQDGKFEEALIHTRKLLASMKGTPIGEKAQKLQAAALAECAAQKLDCK